MATVKNMDNLEAELRDDLDKMREKYLGEHGKITLAFVDLKCRPSHIRHEAGNRLNVIRNRVKHITQ